MRSSYAGVANVRDALLVVPVARVLDVLVVSMIRVLRALVVLVMPATWVFGMLVVPRGMMAAVIGTLVPSVVDVTRPRSVVMIRRTLNLDVVRAKIAGGVVMVSCVDVPARRHESIAVTRWNPVTAHPREAHAGVSPMPFDPNRAHARQLGAHDDASWRRRRRVNDDDARSRLLDDDCATALHDNIVISMAYAVLHFVELGVSGGANA